MDKGKERFIQVQGAVQDTVKGTVQGTLQGLSQGKVTGNRVQWGYSAG